MRGGLGIRAAGALCAAALVCAGTLAVAQQPQPAEFGEWLAALRAEALARHVSAETLDAALAGLAPIERVLELDRRQPEGSMSFEDYLRVVVTDKRVRDGRDYLARNARLLDGLRAEYGVQPQVIVALWGIESDYGRRTGTFSVVAALATLAYDGRRSQFFRGELLEALAILDEGHVEPAAMLGSWAGAMGQPQFMPSSFRSYAVDQDRDARRDIWGSTGDTLASVANYLARHGWRGDLRWGREVRLPPGFDRALVGRDVKKAIDEWQRIGVRRADGSALPRADVVGSIVTPGGDGGPAYLVYDNFGVLLKWNRSDYFAAAVGLLADRLVTPDRRVAASPAPHSADEPALAEPTAFSPEP